MREIGACFYRSDESFIEGRGNLTCLMFGIGILRRFCSFLVTPKNSIAISAYLQKRR